MILKQPMLTQPLLEQYEYTTVWIVGGVDKGIL
jgi:hypothetical protein